MQVINKINIKLLEPDCKGITFLNLDTFFYNQRERFAHSYKPATFEMDYLYYNDWAIYRLHRFFVNDKFGNISVYTPKS